MNHNPFYSATKSSPQNTGIIQKADQLKLLLHGGSIDSMNFKAFHSLKVAKGDWQIGIDIIGESHKINIVNSAKPSSMNEILACIAIDDELSPSCYMEKLSYIEAGKLERIMEGFNYHFSFEKIGFNDERYSKALSSLTEEATYCVSYDFGNNRKDSFDDIFEPVTLVTADVTDDNMKWASLHIYPNDELAIISESSISIQRK